MSRSGVSFEVAFAIQWLYDPEHLVPRIPRIRPIATVINRFDSSGREALKTEKLKISCPSEPNTGNSMYQHYDLKDLHLPKPLEILTGPLCGGFPMDWMDKWTQDKLDGTFYNGTEMRYGGRTAKLETDCYTLPIDEAGDVFLHGILVTSPRICYYTIK